MKTVALVPVKGLDAGKSRLLGVLDDASRRALTLAMLGDVLEALQLVPELDQTAVVTPDPAVGEAARSQGALALVRQDPGLNASLDAAGAELTAAGAELLLVVLGDVAGAHCQDIERLFKELAQVGGRGAILAKARDGGTAALLRSPPGAIPNRFGPDSARAHAAAAAERGVPFQELALPSLSVDLDRREDLQALLSSAAAAPRTRALLGRLANRRAGSEEAAL